MGVVMKKILLAGFTLIAPFAAHCAQAADAALPAYKVPPPAIVYTWTGCYLGVNGGGGRSTNDWGPLFVAGGGAPVALATVRANGFFGGAQVGCDYQAGGWVFGLEGQFDW